MEALALLEKQHRKVERLFRKLEGRNPDIEALLDELANDLAGHMAIEQELFYPAVREAQRDLVLESYEEHALAELALKRLLATDPEDDAFHARLTALKELIQHHVEEEEQELLPKARKALDEAQLRDLGKRMQARFAEVAAQGFDAVLPKGAKTSADASKKLLRSSRRRAA